MERKIEEEIKLELAKIVVSYTEIISNKGVNYDEAMKEVLTFIKQNINS